MDRREDHLTEQISSDYDAPVIGEHENNVVSLGRVPETPKEVEQPLPQPRLHRIAIGGMAAFALLGILAMLAFITVAWPGESGRYVIAVFIFCGVGFLACASTAVFSAARETYAGPRNEKSDHSPA
jgi:hypothetical protein